MVDALYPEAKQRGKEYESSRKVTKEVFVAD
jgi:hypothetical protein